MSDRRVVTPDGREWLVQERVFRLGDLDIPTGCLMATWRSVTRRISTYPADWYSCTDAKLVDLIERSDQTRAREERNVVLSRWGSELLL